MSREALLLSSGRMLSWYINLHLSSFSPTSPHPVTGEQIPITIGHEFAGTIKELGKGVTGFKVGQKVAVQPTIYCADCGACKVGAENACPNGGFVGLSGGGGGMSEEVCVPTKAVFVLPENIDLDVGALVEPLAVAWHAVDASSFKDEKQPKVLVLGGGPVREHVRALYLRRLLIIPNNLRSAWLSCKS